MPCSPQVLLRWLGSLVRVATTITQLAGDPVVLANHVLDRVKCQPLSPCKVGALEPFRLLLACLRLPSLVYRVA